MTLNDLEYFSAMKMETNVPAPVDGVVTSVKALAGQNLTKDDLICEVRPS